MASTFVGRPNPKFSVIMIDDSSHILMSQSSCTLTWNKNLFTKFNPRGFLKKCLADKHVKSQSLGDNYRRYLEGRGSKWTHLVFYNTVIKRPYFESWRSREEDWPNQVASTPSLSLEIKSYPCALPSYAWRTSFQRLCLRFRVCG